MINKILGSLLEAVLLPIYFLYKTLETARVRKSIAEAKAYLKRTSRFPGGR